MSQYHHSHAGYAPTYGTTSYGQPYVNGMSQGYAPSGGVMMQPTMMQPQMVQPQMVQSVGVPVAAPVMMQPGGYNGYGRPYYTWGQRFRRFFGLAPSNGVRYKRDHTTWGFMGYSRRQRYTDPRTGGEVDRKGRPVYRV